MERVGELYWALVVLKASCSIDVNAAYAPPDAFSGLFACWLG